MARSGTLVSRVAEDLRSALAAGQYATGAKLPPEAELAAQFGVSRPTLRAALRELETLGLVKTAHGVGTFVVEQPAVRTGLERLDSITESIRATGRVPGMTYASRILRAVLPEEAARMEVPGDTQVLEIRRRILGDGEVLAYSYDLMPAHLLPQDFEPEELDGSLFAFMGHRLNRVPVTAFAEVHAVESNHVGWGSEAATHTLFLLLNQLHHDISGELVLYSRTYFIEGRYTFTLVRSS